MTPFPYFFFPPEYCCVVPTNSSLFCVQDFILTNRKHPATTICFYFNKKVFKPNDGVEGIQSSVMEKRNSCP